MLWNRSIRTSINLASSSSVWFSSHMHQWDLTRDPLAASHRSHTHILTAEDREHPTKLKLWRYSDPNITTWHSPNLLKYLRLFFLLLTLTLRKFFHFHCIIYPTHLQLPWWRDNQCNSLHLPVVIILCLIIIITAWLWMTRFSTEPCPLKFRFPTAKNYSGSREAFLSHKQVVKQNIFLVYSVTFIYYHFT